MAIYTLYDNLGMKLSVLCFRTGVAYKRVVYWCEIYKPKSQAINAL